MGHPKKTSPWLDQLSEKAVDFRWAISPSNVTRQSVAAYFTGTHFSHLQNSPANEQLGRQFARPRPSETSVILPESAETLAETFSSAGFKTSLWSANVLIRKEWGFGQGFERFTYVKRHGSVKARISEIAETIRTTYRKSDGKEFIYIHTMDVHMPYRPPLRFEREFLTRANDRGVVREGIIEDEDYFREYGISTQPFYAEGHSAAHADYALLHDLYNGEIRRTDAQLPILLASLQHDPEKDLVIITADHGEQFLEHGFWGHGFSCLSHDVRVPLLVWWNGFAAASHNQPVSLIDLYPTLCDLYALPKPEALLGKSLLPVLSGEAKPNHPVYTEMAAVVGPGAAVIADGYWYWFQSDMYFLRPGVAWPFLEGLYEYSIDPWQHRNLITNQPEVADRMNALLREVNPRWAPFTPDLIRPRGSPATRGENLLQESFTVTNTVDRAPNKNDAMVWNMAMADGQIRYDVEIDGPGMAHLFSGSYTLEDGELTFDLRDKETGEIFWSHTRRHTRTQPVPFRAMVRPSSSHIELLIKATGNVKLFNLSLERAFVPELRVVPVSTHEAQENTVEELDPDTIERIRNLGYAQ